MPTPPNPAPTADAAHVPDVYGLPSVDQLRELAGALSIAEDDEGHVADSALATLIEQARFALDAYYDEKLNRTIASGQSLGLGDEDVTRVELPVRTDAAHPLVGVAVIPDGAAERKPTTSGNEAPSAAPDDAVRFAPYARDVLLANGLPLDYDASIEQTAEQSPFPVRRFAVRGRRILVLPLSAGRVYADLVPEAALRQRLTGDVIAKVQAALVDGAVRLAANTDREGRRILALDLRLDEDQ